MHYAGILTAAEVAAMRKGAMRQGAHGADLMDALQEAAVSMWRCGLRGADVATLEARNAAVELTRARLGRNGHKSTEALSDTWDAPGPDDAAGGARVREALRSLPAQQLDLAARLIEADEAQDVAHDLGVSPSLISARRQRLRAALAAYL